MGLIILLIIVGIVLLLAELLLIPGVGIAGVLGLASLIGANFIAFFYYSQTVGVVVLVVTLIICIIVVWYALRAKTWKRLSLQHEIEAKAISSPKDLGIHIGMKGKTIGRLIPSGKARFDTTDVEVYALHGVIDPGTEVEVVQIEDMRIFVVSEKSI
ncbi:MAG: NfeD family protein [Prevotellaceae bacterium]|jgi:membrane-bound ClpP family serine protease|nr:NfeD family protein [Prevotellaceae bacterium]